MCIFLPDFTLYIFTIYKKIITMSTTTYEFSYRIIKPGNALIFYSHFPTEALAMLFKFYVPFKIQINWQNDIIKNNGVGSFTFSFHKSSDWVSEI